ncbi:putative adenylyltransferase/sulfurtransferase MoeZ [Paenibacillus sp. P1XP2]|nr:putative adenylyltransferase/sulfurtransferase MoeZ [Paenibacillus sp. P1XP2]
MSGNGTRNGRYSRQELFPKIGPDGQRKLGERHVLIVGAGALGSGSAETLVRAGVGTVTIVDRDYVEPSNLQRQQLYSEEDALLRLPKAAAAKARLERINPDIDIRAVVADVAIPEIDELAQGVNVILDGTDNFETRLLINDMSQKKGIPWIYGACVAATD